MLNRQFYYTLKPFLPWRVRMAMRRFVAKRQRETCKATWPIDERVATKPQGWPGWPDGKKFAFVITHDVEGPEGLAKVRQLAELEMKLGIRSSFNFIPEGPYSVPPDLRAWLTQNGFEVGVHDLHHDGKLFSSRRGFTDKAKRINHYLRDWQASGYRSGFMLRNLDWLHELSIRYDSSTFDTDPFEPQSEGAGTIFPYWIPLPGDQGAKREAQSGNGAKGEGQGAKSPFDKLRAGEGDQPSTVDRLPRQSYRDAIATAGPPTQVSGLRSQVSLTPASSGGYVELPYTLPQDSTLFLVLQEKSPEIWLRKIDWIAGHGGMALLNVHPDYLQFPDDPPSAHTYPVSHYLQFLEQVRQHHGAGYWQALPEDVAAFVLQLDSRPMRTRTKRVGMITHSFYETDNRVTRYAEALAARGDHVEVLSLRRSPETAGEETINGVRVSRIQNRFAKTEQTRLAYFWPVFRFLFASSWQLTRRHRSLPYDVIHVHNIPDFLVFAALYPKLAGARVILDIHDIVPEFYASKFGARKESTTSAALRLMERVSARFSHHIIISNHLWLEKYATRTRTKDRCSVYINNVDTQVFRAGLRKRRPDGKIIILFPGGLQWHQGLDIALHAFVQVSREFPQAEFHIYGDGIMKPSLIALSAELGLNGRVRFFEPVRITEIAQVMANADLGVVPKRADSFGNQAYSTKIMEFMSLGVPVVVSKTEIDRFYFNDSVVRFFDSGNPDALAAGMLAVLRDTGLRTRMITAAAAYAELHSWDTRKADYLQLVDSLCQDSPARDHAP